MRGAHRRTIRVGAAACLWLSLFPFRGSVDAAPGVVSPPPRALSIPRTLGRAASPAPRTPLRPEFAPTHVAFSWTGTEGSGLDFITISPSGSRSAWAAAPESHDLERGRRHYSGVLAVDRPAAIEWKPARRDDELRRVRVVYMNTIDGPRETVELPRAPARGPSTPDIVTRAEWGADESVKDTTGGCDRDFYPVQQLFVHHTAGSNFDSNPKATMRAIYWYHTVNRGWCDIGYNFVIDPEGTIYEGRWARKYQSWETHSSENRRGDAVAGAHVESFNSGSVGISLMGNFSEVDVPPEARRSLAELLAWEVDRHHLDTHAKHRYKNPETGLSRRLFYIAGHRDAGQTECPGNRLYRALPAVRDDTAAAIGTGKADSFVTLTPSAQRVSYGDEVTYSGVLTDENGAALPMREVSIFRRDGKGDWGPEVQVVTGVDGSFSHSVTPEKNVNLIAFFEGDDSLWGAQSEPDTVHVRPDVTIAPEGGSPDAAGVSHYPSTTKKIFLSGTVLPVHEGREVQVTVRQVLDDGSLVVVATKIVTLDSASSYRYRFVVRGPGSYRAVGKFLKDADHASSASPPVAFVVDS